MSRRSRRRRVPTLIAHWFDALGRVRVGLFFGRGFSMSWRVWRPGELVESESIEELSAVEAFLAWAHAQVEGAEPPPGWVIESMSERAAADLYAVEAMPRPSVVH